MQIVSTTTEQHRQALWSWRYRRSMWRYKRSMWCVLRRNRRSTLRRYRENNAESYLRRQEPLCRQQRGGPSASGAGRACGSPPAPVSPSPPEGLPWAGPSWRRCTRRSRRPGPLDTAPPGEPPHHWPPACPSVTGNVKENLRQKPGRLRFTHERKRRREIPAIRLPVSALTLFYY